MNLPDRLEHQDILWIVAILGTSAAALLLNLVGLLFGISTAVPHILYIPVVLAAYRYPRWGAHIAGCIGAIYFLLVLFLRMGTWSTVGEAFVRVRKRGREEDSEYSHWGLAALYYSLDTNTGEERWKPERR